VKDTALLYFKHRELLTEVEPESSSTYVLVSILELPNKGSESGDKELPKTTLLVILLDMIFIKGNSLIQDEIQAFLILMMVQARKKHFAYRKPGNSPEIWCRESTWSTCKCLT
jgi:hypothetical protein